MRGRRLLGLLGLVPAVGCAFLSGLDAYEVSECPGSACVDGSVVDGRSSFDGGSSSSDGATDSDVGASSDGSVVDSAIGEAAVDSGALPDLRDASMVTVGERPDADLHGVVTDTVVQLAPASNALNYGRAMVLRVDSDPGDEYIGLLRFDLGAIGDRKVESATLRISAAVDNSCAASGAQLYRLLEAWTGGNEDGQPGVANGVYRQLGVAWSGPGISGASIDPSSVVFFNLPTIDTDVAINVTNLVRDWIAKPNTNYGIALKAAPNGDGFCMYSSENVARPDLRPLLTVKLSLP